MKKMAFTRLIRKQMILLHQLPMCLKCLCSPGCMENRGIILKQLLERLDCRLTRLRKNSFDQLLWKCNKKMTNTEEMVASNCSSALVYSALAWTAATVCGWRFLKAARANRETDLSYSKAYHRSVISVNVKWHENFTPLCTANKSPVCTSS